jgi:hypothetical protein
VLGVKLLSTYELPQEPSVVSDLGLPTCFESDQLSEDEVWQSFDSYKKAEEEIAITTTGELKRLCLGCHHLASLDDGTGSINIVCSSKIVL